MLQGAVWDLKNGRTVVRHKTVLQRTRGRGRLGFVESCHGCLRRQLVTRRRAQSDKEEQSAVVYCSSYNSLESIIPSGPLSPVSSPIEEQDKSKEPGVRCVYNQRVIGSFSCVLVASSFLCLHYITYDVSCQINETWRWTGRRIALSILKFYKTGISPLLPPSCRFLPTCSVYAAEAYSTYGVKKGTILTVWRLLRCTPWGDSGYDPVQWPPPKLGFLGKW